MKKRLDLLDAFFQPKTIHSEVRLRPSYVALGLVLSVWSLSLTVLTILLADRFALLVPDRLLFNITSSVLVIATSYVVLRLVVRQLAAGLRRRISQIIVLCLTTSLWAVFSGWVINDFSYSIVWIPYLVISAGGYWFTRRIVLRMNAFQFAREEQEQKRIHEARSALYSFGVDVDGYYLIEFIDALSQVSDRSMIRKHLSLANALLRRRIQLPEAKALTLCAALDEVRGLGELSCVKTEIRIDRSVGGQIESVPFPPLLLSHLLNLLVAYAQERFIPLRVRIEVSERDDALDVSIETNLPATALLYDSPESSAATMALRHFREHLNRGKRHGVLFERGETSGGNLVVAFALSPIWQVQDPERRWENLASLIPTDAPQYLADGWTGCRVYRQRSLTWKVARTATPEKMRSLEGEYQILRRLEGLPYVPKPLTFFADSNAEFLAYQYVAGCHVDKYLGDKLPDSARVRLLCDLSDAIVSINARGVFHRDIKPSNVLIDDGGNIHIVDFDQAIYIPFEQRTEWDNGLKAEIASINTPNDLVTELGLEEHALTIADELASVWALARRSDANSPGVGLAYYQWNFCGHVLDGERPWLDRMLSLSAYLGSPRQMTVLELGCNLGLLSCYMSLNGAVKVVGADVNNDILVAAERLAQILRVTPTFKQVDINSPHDLANLDGRYDVVFVLSIMNWLSNVNPLLEFLAEQECVIFEGHQSTRDEIAMFQQLGFSRVDVICYTERLRALLCARK